MSEHEMMQMIENSDLKVQAVSPPLKKLGVFGGGSRQKHADFG